jgi:hypothetical protein
MFHEVSPLATSKLFQFPILKKGSGCPHVAKAEGSPPVFVFAVQESLVADARVAGPSIRNWIKFRRQ